PARTISVISLQNCPGCFSSVLSKSLIMADFLLPPGQNAPRPSRSATPGKERDWSEKGCGFPGRKGYMTSATRVMACDCCNVMAIDVNLSSSLKFWEWSYVSRTPRLMRGVRHRKPHGRTGGALSTSQPCRRLLSARYLIPRPVWTNYFYTTIR